MTTAEARQIQIELTKVVSRANFVNDPKVIAGADVSVDRIKHEGKAAVVVLSYPQFEIIEKQTAYGEVNFPYIPGLLSFREMPLTLSAFEKLQYTPDLVLVDGAGIAHPRRMGLASHLGLFLDIPTVGCAKSLLTGEWIELGLERGSLSDITDTGEVIGAAVRTRAGVKPMYISIGHMVDLPTALIWTLKCCRGFRIPEPTRLAHIASRANRKKSGIVLKS